MLRADSRAQSANAHLDEPHRRFQHCWMRVEVLIWVLSGLFIVETSVLKLFQLLRLHVVHLLFCYFVCVTYTVTLCFHSFAQGDIGREVTMMAAERRVVDAGDDSYASHSSQAPPPPTAKRKIHSEDEPLPAPTNPPKRAKKAVRYPLH